MSPAPQKAAPVAKLTGEDAAAATPIDPADQAASPGLADLQAAQALPSPDAPAQNGPAPAGLARSAPTSPPIQAQEPASALRRAAPSHAAAAQAPQPALSATSSPVAGTPSNNLPDSTPSVTPAPAIPQHGAPPVAPPPTTTTTTSAPEPPQAPPPAAPAATAPPPPAQLAPVFATLAPAAQPGATQQLVIRLDPAELGHVQVRIDRPADGPAHVVLAVERADTLMLLMQDRPQLNQALNAAGLAPEGRTLQFSLSSGGSQGDSQGGQAGGQAFSGGGQNGRDAPPRPAARTAWLRAGIDITA